MTFLLIFLAVNLVALEVGLRASEAISHAVYDIIPTALRRRTI